MAAGPWPVPLAPPGLPGEEAHQCEVERAAVAKAHKGDTLGDGLVLYEDAWLLVLNKPAGWYCEELPDALCRLRRGAGISCPSALPGKCSEDAPSAAVKTCTSAKPTGLQDTSGLCRCFTLAHRLDRDTSGALLLCKRREALAPLAALFAADGGVRKSYLALCAGQPFPQQVVHSGHGRSRGGLWRVYGAADVGRTLPGGSRVRAMTTSLRVEAITPDGALVVVAHLHTGRTHQVRLHCAHAGVPIIGDVRYGGPGVWCGTPVPGCLL
eukprot:EG_transcript_21566